MTPQGSDLEPGPVLDLARQLHAEVRRWVDDAEADPDALVEAFDHLPREARRRIAEATFAGLPIGQRWAVLERLFGDDELRAALDHQRQLDLASARAVVRRAAVVERAAADGVVDTTLLPDGERLTLGLFRQADVAAALTRGRASATCARRLVLRATDRPGVLRAVEDVFNPLGGLFVTPDYDEGTWRAERLDGHAAVRVGSADDIDRVDPLVHPGARLDVELAGHVRPGHLHVGWAAVGDRDLFPPTTAPSGGTSP